MDYLPYNFQKKKHGVEQVRSEEEMERLLSEKDSKNTKRAILTNLWYNVVCQMLSTKFMV